MSFFKIKPFVNFIIGISIFSQLTKSQTQAANLNDLPDDLKEKIIFILEQEAAIKDIKSLAQTSKSFYQGRIKETIKKIMQKSVTLSDGTCLHVDEAINLEKISEIQKFNFLEAFEYFLHKAPVRTFHDINRGKVVLPTEDEGDLSFTKFIMKSKAKKIASFIAHKTLELQNAPILISKAKIAYSLLMSMAAYEDAVQKTSASAATINSLKYALAASQMSFSRRDCSNHPDAPTTLASASAGNAAREADLQHASNAALLAATNAARHANLMTVMAAVQKAANTVAPAFTTLRIQDEGKKAYLRAEKVFLLVFLREFEKILEASFQKAMSAMPEISDDKDIFLSKERWENFKDQNFRQLSKQQMLYISPWLSQLDKLAGPYEYASEI